MLFRKSDFILVAALVLSPLISYELGSHGNFVVKHADAARRVRAAALPEVVSISLVNADSNEVIPEFDPIENGDEVDLTLLPSENINIRANIANGTARSVRFQVVRQRQSVVDDAKPFSLRDRNGDYSSFPFIKGSHTVKVTPYTNTTARGLRTSTYQVSFKIKKSRRSPTPSPSQSPSFIPTPSPSASPSPIPSASPSPTPTPTPTLAPSPTPSPSGTPRPSPTVSTIAIPERAQWEQNMLVFGNMHCNALVDPTVGFDTKLLSTYYDGQHVFFQIADYLDNGFFNTCAERAEAIYRDQYAGLYSGYVPGYWNFTHGLHDSYLRTNDATSRTVAIQLAENAAFARDSTQLSETIPMEANRETAYAIHAYLNAEDLGQPRRARLATLVNHALGHLDQWYGSRSAAYVRPFMVGLTAHALINYYERTGDSRIVPALQQAADAMFAELWVESALAFRYTDRLINPGDLDPAPDLNMLIAPLYGFLFHETGDSKYLVQGDKIFKGGVLGAYLYNGKQFNQSYRWSFDYVHYRTIAPKR